MREVIKCTHPLPLRVEDESGMVSCGNCKMLLIGKNIRFEEVV